MSSENGQQNNKASGWLWRLIVGLLVVVASLIALVWSDLKAGNETVRDDIRSIREVMTELDGRIGNLERLQANRREAWSMAQHIEYDTRLNEWRLQIERRLTRLEAERGGE